jgi:hypothetical protein
MSGVELMLTSKKLAARALAATALGGGLLLASPASAIITCNSNGDCWRTETRITYPNVTFTYHDDPWWEAHKTERTYVFHDTDADHDWHHGYWMKGEWHAGD